MCCFVAEILTGRGGTSEGVFTLPIIMFSFPLLVIIITVNTELVIVSLTLF
jgi:hypothetical protein